MAIVIMLLTLIVLLLALRSPSAAACLSGKQIMTPSPQRLRTSLAAGTAAAVEPAVSVVPGAPAIGSERTWTPAPVAVTASPSAAPSRPHGDADGCHHVFIDAGSNLGVHGRFLFEPEKYPNATWARGVFDQQLGPVSQRRRNTCVFAFEPNPAHAEHQRATQDSYRAMGWRYTYTGMGVGIKNETLKFYRNDGVAKGSKMEEWGFGYLNRAKGFADRFANRKVLVPVLDFAEWLDRVVFPRLLPTQLDRAWGEPKVVLKLDIEGMEVGLIPHMLTRGVLCKIDFLFGDVHSRYDFGPYYLKNGIVLKGDEAQAWVDSINRILQADDCPATMQAIDDETYVHDGQPWPTPP